MANRFGCVHFIVEPYTTVRSMCVFSHTVPYIQLKLTIFTHLITAVLLNCTGHNKYTARKQTIFICILSSLSL